MSFGGFLRSNFRFLFEHIFSSLLKMIYAILALLAVAASAVTPTLYTEDVSVQKAMFDKFKLTYKRSYSSKEEESTKFSIFMENMKVADARNIADAKAGGTAVHGVTKYSDLTQEEFLRLVIGFNRETGPRSTEGRELWITENDVPDSTTAGGSWVNYISPIRTQGLCACSWVMAATNQIETDLAIQLNSLDPDWYSAQQIVTCCRANVNSCATGKVEQAYVYSTRAGGLEADSSYAYTNQEFNYTLTPCTSDSAEYIVSVPNFKSLVSNETTMKNYLLNNGTFAAEFDATIWNSYTSGVVSACGDGANIGYYAQVIAVLTGSSGYWTVRNSLGPDWGEEGMILLKYGQNTCNITYDPTVSVVAPL